MSTDNYDQVLEYLREEYRIASALVERTLETLADQISTRDSAKASLDEWTGVTA